MYTSKFLHMFSQSPQPPLFTNGRVVWTVLCHVCFMYQNFMETILCQFKKNLIFSSFVGFNIIFKKKNFLCACLP